MDSLKSDTPIRCSCSLRTVLVSNSPNVRHRWKDKGKELTWMNEGPLMVVAVSWSAAPSVRVVSGGRIYEVSDAGEMDSMRDDCISSWWSGVLRSSTHPHPPPYPRWSPGVEQLNHPGLLTHGLSTAQYTISLCSWPDQCGHLTVCCPSGRHSNWCLL